MEGIEGDGIGRWSVGHSGPVRLVRLRGTRRSANAHRPVVVCVSGAGPAIAGGGSSEDRPNRCPRCPHRATHGRRAVTPLVVVPSFGRAGGVTTVDVFPGGVIVVPNRQVDAYRKQEIPDTWEIVGIPDEQDGNISRKRNAILDLYPGRDLVMVDDDYSFLGRHMGHVEFIHQDADQIGHLLSEGFRMTRELGTVLWGIALNWDPRTFQSMRPFSLTNVVLGPFHAWTAERPKDIRYDEDLWLKEDYDASLQVLRRYHRILRMNMFHYYVDHQNRLGGIVGQRNMGEEVRQLRRLQAKWGSDIVHLELHRSVNPIVRSPIPGT